MEVIFLNPVWLFLLLFLPLLIYTHFFVFSNLKKKAFKFANFETLKRVTGAGFVSKGSTFIGKNIFLLILRIFVFTFIIFAVAGTSLSIKTQMLDGTFVIALDSSSSMLADDFKPNRITAAKDSITKFIGAPDTQLKGGVISFAGEEFIEQSITTDKNKLLRAVESIHTRVSGGTDFNRALFTAINMMENEEKGKSVVLITDGRSTSGNPIDEAVEYANSKGVVINTIGMATEKGGSFLNIESISKLDDASLKLLANKTGGAYFHAEDSTELATILTTAFTKSEGKVKIDLKGWFMALGAVFLMVEWVLANTKYRGIP